MIFVGMLVLCLVVVWFRHRSSRKSELGGLNADRPVFSVDPPARRLGARKRERL